MICRMLGTPIFGTTLVPKLKTTDPEGQSVQEQKLGARILAPSSRCSGHELSGAHCPWTYRWHPDPKISHTNSRCWRHIPPPRKHSETSSKHPRRLTRFGKGTSTRPGVPDIFFVCSWYRVSQYHAPAILLVSYLSPLCSPGSEESSSLEMTPPNSRNNTEGRSPLISRYF